MITFDSSLVRGYSPELAKKQPKGVYSATFGTEKSQLYYIAAEHQQAGKDNSTLPLVTEAFRDFQPDFVVIEAPSFVNSEQYGAIKPAGMDEAVFTAFMAQQNNVPFKGAEPDDAALFKALKERGYTDHDVMGLYLLRWIPKGEPSGASLIPFRDESHLAVFANAYSSNHSCFDSVPREERLDYNGFKQWFDEKNNGAIERPIWQLTSNDTMPFNGSDANYFQRLNHHVGLAREESVNQTIETALRQYDKVLVVYGGGHLVQSLPVYEKALGAAQYNSSYPAAEVVRDIGGLPQPSPLPLEITTKIKQL